MVSKLGGLGSFRPGLWVCFMSLVCLLSSNQAIETQDRATFNAIRSSLESVHPNWMGDTAGLCSFPGVTCSNETDQIISLDIEGLDMKNGLTGDFPCGLLTEFPSLTLLNLPNQKLTGNISKCTPICGAGLLPDFSACQSLTLLTLADNNFNGPYPPSLLQLPNLEEVTFQNNELSGDVPPELFLQPKLLFLSLSGNRLTGSLPPACNKTMWNGLSLDQNYLSGPIPEWIFDITDSSNGLDLSHNNFDCPTFAQLNKLQSNVKNLERLSFFGLNDCTAFKTLNNTRHIQAMPYRSSSYVRPAGEPSSRLESEKLLTLGHGTSLYLYVKQNGTVLDDKYIHFQFQGVARARLVLDDIRGPLLEEYEIKSFDPPVYSTTRGTMSISATLDNGAKFLVIFTTEYPNSDLKFSFELTNWTAETEDMAKSYFYFHQQVTLVTPLSDTGKDFRFESYPTGSTFEADLLKFEITPAEFGDSGELGLGVFVSSTDFTMSCAFPYQYEVDGVSKPSPIVLKDLVAYAEPFGPVVFVSEILGPNGLVVPRSGQRLTATYSLVLDSGFNHSIGYDPIINVQALFAADSPTSPETLAITGGAIAGIVVAAVVVVVLASVLVPFRKKVFPWLFRDKTTYKMDPQNGLTIEEPKAKSGGESQQWTKTVANDSTALTNI